VSDPGRAGGVTMAAGGVGDEGGRALPGALAVSGGGRVEYCTGVGAAGASRAWKRWPAL